MNNAIISSPPCNNECSQHLCGPGVVIQIRGGSMLTQHHRYACYKSVCIIRRKRNCASVIELKPLTVINVFKLDSGCFKATALQVTQTHRQHMHTLMLWGICIWTWSSPAAWLMEEDRLADISDRHSITSDALRLRNHKAWQDTDCGWHGMTYC